MFKNTSVIIIICLMVFACKKSDAPKKPENLIGKEKMSLILYDLYIVNAAKGVNRKILETNGFKPETYVLNKYSIDSLQFAESNTYYAFNQEEYKGIVDDVKSRLEKEKKELLELQKIEDAATKKRRDSIRDLNKVKKDSLKKALKEKNRT